MAEQENIQIVQQALAALRQGQVSAVLEKLADDIQWRAFGLIDRLPGIDTFCGKEQVGQFLAKLSRSGTLQKFEPQEFMAQRDQVAVWGQSEQIGPVVGRVIHFDWVMVFRLYNGKIVDHQYCDDAIVTAAQESQG
jgi:ketosteroid isomerase-like protein